MRWRNADKAPRVQGRGARWILEGRPVAGANVWQRWRNVPSTQLITAG